MTRRVSVATALPRTATAQASGKTTARADTHAFGTSVLPQRRNPEVANMVERRLRPAARARRASRAVAAAAALLLTAGLTGCGDPGGGGGGGGYLTDRQLSSGR